jgi:L-seryl-tRNA(Ser) seleniumtransferase
MSDNPFRKLPSVTLVLQAAPVAGLGDAYPHDRIVAAIRAELDELRQGLTAGQLLDGRLSPESVAERAAARLRLDMRPKLRRVINATGIVLHTNLGRAPLAVAAVEAVAAAAAGYLNLELDLDTGKRSSRQDAIREWVTKLTGAESATAVNNNAAATVIVLRAVCAGKEVIVSRGQLIEIGGSFRIPEIMAVSGATLREIGTTNITRLADYAKVIGPNTGALMQVHTSNYRVSGFTKSVPLAELVELGRKHNLPVIDDAGSGALFDFNRFGFTGEPVVKESIQTGADLVLFSGDKLLGGPQAGIIAGKAALIQKIEKDPLMRAFRLDKMTLAALEATLRLYLDEERALREVPTLRMLATTKEDLRPRAEALATRLRDLAGLASVRLVDDVAYVGGGSLPDQAMPTVVIGLAPANISDADLGSRLRAETPAVMGRLSEGKLLLDLRTVFPEQDEELLEAVRHALSCQ